MTRAGAARLTGKGRTCILRHLLHVSISCAPVVFDTCVVLGGLDGVSDGAERLRCQSDK
jgi:hypothetical protein